MGHHLHLLEEEVTMIETIVTYRNPYAGLSSAQVAYVSLSKAIKVLIASDERADYIGAIQPAVHKLQRIREKHFRHFHAAGISVFAKLEE
jgi:hypothetical protein